MSFFFLARFERGSRNDDAGEARTEAESAGKKMRLRFVDRVKSKRRGRGSIRVLSYWDHDWSAKAALARRERTSEEEGEGKRRAGERGTRE